jgi:hypothetical protein
MDGGGKFSGNIAIDSIHRRFIESAPEADLVRQSLHNLTSEPGEHGATALALESSLFREPQRVGEVVQGDHRLDTVGPEFPHDTLIMRKNALIEYPFLWFDLAPLHREAIRIQSEGAHELDVLPVAGPVLTSFPRLLISSHTGSGIRTNGVFESEPVVVQAVSLHLVGGGCTTPQKPGGI